MYNNHKILDCHVHCALQNDSEMYENFSADKERTLAFFTKYHDRICYGTDIGGRCILMGEHKEFDTDENVRRPQIVRTFLESKESVLIQSDGHYLIGRPDFVMNCLGLADDILNEIFYENFFSFANGMPKNTDKDKVDSIEDYVRQRQNKQVKYQTKGVKQNRP